MKALARKTFGNSSKSKNRENECPASPLSKYRELYVN